MATPDFIRLNGEAIRLTSLTRDPDGDRLIAIVLLRGRREHEQIADLLGRSPVTVELPSEEPRPMAVARNDYTSTGEGPRTLYRHVIELRAGNGEMAPEVREEPLEQRLARIEAKVDRVLALLERA